MNFLCLHANIAIVITIVMNGVLLQLITGVNVPRHCLNDAESIQKDSYHACVKFQAYEQSDDFIDDFRHRES